MVSNKTTRRNFLKTSVAVAGGIVGTSACQQLTNSTVEPSANSNSTADLNSQGTSTLVSSTALEKMPQRVLGRTGVTVPILGLGGSASPLSRPQEDEEANSIAIIERAYELGIRYFDTASNYGPSEERLGKVLPPHRKEIFLASKSNARDRDRAWKELEQSLKLLKTDYLDLWQFHSVSFDWNLDAIFNSKHGAIRVAREAKEQKIVRFVGITGHNNPAIIAKALRRYSFDTALIPVNAADKHTPSPFITGVLPVAQKNNTGIIAMKVPAYGRLFKPGILDGMHQAMGYALSQPGVHCCIIAAEDVRLLEQNVRVASAFQSLSKQELQAIEQRTASVWQDSSFFRQWA
ncbi:twin-arginine translocation signal domain-containing protein [Scytonema sp. UIC 10036]|uniref:aldo/keto reductase n=1 Tax=Scytonema sp. UIC 10036 TaxID=2304196 RepID=UPI0012DA4E6A|nr:aldo/keto reductase [Scytonema sp. UIC 10036]MUG91874.1 twin-arginine translocation signal domain-containing protein [Scytonema sp. UIC 10036]